MPKHTDRNLPYYFAAGGVFVLLKFAFRYADTADLVFLLKPVDSLVGLLAGSYSIPHAEGGYFHESLNIIIDKSCSGFNFWVLSFLLFTYLALKYFDRTLSKILTIPASLAVAYLLTVFVNTSRIFASIVVQRQTQSLLASHQRLIHEAIGIITYLSFLVLAYILIEKLLKNRQQNEKLA